MQVTKPDNTDTDTLVDLGGDVSHESSQPSRPAAEVNGHGTVSSSSADKLGNEDFDMFAQSRQSFEDNLPRVKYVTLPVILILFAAGFVVFHVFCTYFFSYFMLSAVQCN